MIQETESFIDGLMNGNKELNLVRLEDSDFQTKMEELNEYFLMLNIEDDKTLGIASKERTS